MAKEKEIKKEIEEKTKKKTVKKSGVATNKSTNTKTKRQQKAINSDKSNAKSKQKNIDKEIENDKLVKSTNDAFIGFEKKTNDETTIKDQEGVVAGCGKLYVRNKPNLTNSTIIDVIAAGQEVLINLSESTNTFYKVLVNGHVGYCVKRYIKFK